MSKIETTTEEIPSNIETSIEDNSADVEDNSEPVPLEKAAKPKKPRTEKQIEAFKQAQLKRAENVAAKKAIPKSKPVSKATPVPVPVPVPPTPAASVETEEEYSSDEEIIVRKKPKMKKKKKQIVIELSDSEEESESEPEPAPVAKTPKASIKKESKFESQQHKKYSKPAAQTKTNLFCD